MLNEPAIGSAFFGREDVLETLEKRVTALKSGYRQNVALTGQMLSGKSSILYQFLYTLKDASLVPVYIEVVEEAFASFANKFIATLLYNYFVLCGEAARKELSDLIKTAESRIPRTAYAIKKVRHELSRRSYNTAYRGLLNLTSVLKEETGKSCVVILDEFHNLEHFKIRKPYLHFGKIIMIQKDTMYIVSSSRKNTIRKILSEKLALLYGNFEIIEISGFDNKTAEAFIKGKLGVIAAPDIYLDYIIDFTDRNPFYLDVLTKKMVEIANLRKISSIDEAALVEAFTTLIYNTSGTINQYFTNSIMSLLEKDARKDHLDVLIALSCGFKKLSEIAKWFKKKNSSGLTAKLSRLIELDLVYKNGVFYQIQDKVFEFWLKSVYHEKKTSLVGDIIDRANDFKNAVSDDLNEFAEENPKGALERIKELFTLFNGETVQIERKKKRLPRSVKIEVRKYARCEDLLTHQASEKCWVCEIWRDKIDESAISDFLERYYPMRDRVSKRICVALEGIDANALLLAKEKNIWIWNLSDINGLLRLYKRHNLIRR